MRWGKQALPVWGVRSAALTGAGGRSEQPGALPTLTVITRGGRDGKPKGGGRSSSGPEEEADRVRWAWGGLEKTEFRFPAAEGEAQREEGFCPK